MSDHQAIDIGAAAQLGLAAALGAFGKAVATKLMRVARPPKPPAGLEAQIEQLRHEMHAGFARVNERLDDVEGNVGELQGQMTYVRRRLGAQMGD